MKLLIRSNQSLHLTQSSHLLQKASSLWVSMFNSCTQWNNVTRQSYATGCAYNCSMWVVEKEQGGQGSSAECWRADSRSGVIGVVATEWFSCILRSSVSLVCYVIKVPTNAVRGCQPTWWLEGQKLHEHVVQYAVSSHTDPTSVRVGLAQLL